LQVYTKHRLRQLKKKLPRCEAELEQRQSVKVRIRKTVFNNGEQAAFITNMSKGSASDIKRLYRKRWSIKKYYTLKNKLKIESVTVNASIYVKHYFWAQMLVSNTAWTLPQ